MKKTSISILMALAMLGACNDDNNDLDDLEVTPIGTIGETATFSANIIGVAPFTGVSGTAQVTTVVGSESMDITVSISGDTAGSIRAWRLVSGTCANPVAVVGTVDEFPNLVVTSNGTATVSATVPELFDPNQVFHIEFFASPDATNRSTDLIACGDLVLQ